MSIAAINEQLLRAIGVGVALLDRNSLQLRRASTQPGHRLQRSRQRPAETIGIAFSRNLFLTLAVLGWSAECFARLGVELVKNVVVVGDSWRRDIVVGAVAQQGD